jgi:pSer/pThr/pTyr-binding forkhead associated (FHA) protein
MNKLIITDDEGKTTVVPLVRDEITIGRKEGNTIRLTERNISRAHARLIRTNGTFIIEDLVSYNGVKVNGIPVDGPRSVEDGDRISIGDYQLSLRSDRPLAAPAPMARPAEPPPYPRLVMLGPPDAGSEIALDQPEMIVGRTDENAIVINHRSISRQHARIDLKDGCVRLYDLQSANGIRVNGQDFTEVELRRGDLVELGTVRLRFVAAGEMYQFDADATVQMDSVPEDVLAEVGRRPMMPIVMGVGVVVILGVAGLIAWAILSNRPEPDETPAATGPTEPVDQVPRPAPSGRTPEEVKARARDLLEQSEFEAVIGVLDSLGPSADPEVALLRATAALEQESRGLWNTACQGSEDHDVTSVYTACKLIKAESRFHRLGCCEKAADRYGSKQVDEVASLLRSRSYQEAIDQAKALNDDAEISEDIRGRAADLMEKAQRKLHAIELAQAPGPGKIKIDPHEKVKRPPPLDHGEEPEVSKQPLPSTDDPVKAARQAALGGDYRGCIRGLSRTAKSSAVVGVLLYCYQNAGDITAACQLAKNYQHYSSANQFYTARCR